MNAEFNNLSHLTPILDTGVKKPSTQQGPRFIGAKILRVAIPIFIGLLSTVAISIGILSFVAVLPLPLPLGITAIAVGVIGVCTLVAVEIYKKKTNPQTVTIVDSQAHPSLLVASSNTNVRSSTLDQQPAISNIQISSTVKKSNAEIGKSQLSDTSSQTDIIQQIPRALNKDKRLSHSIEAVINDVCCDIHYTNGVAGIEEAEVILFGESHFDLKHKELEASIINQLFRPGDIVLVEGFPQNNSINPEKILKIKREKLLLSDHVQIDGWENWDSYVSSGVVLNQLFDLRLLFQKARNDHKLSSELRLSDGQSAAIIKEWHKNSLERSHHMIDAIKKAKAKANRIFVIAGGTHLIDDGKESDESFKFHALRYLKGFRCAMFVMKDTGFTKNYSLADYHSLLKKNVALASLEL